MTTLLPIVWKEGDPAVRARIEAALDDGLRDATPLSRNPRRTVFRLRQPRDTPSAHDASDTADIVFKIHHTATGRHPWREGWKRRIGRSPSRREWDALEDLSAAGVRVPRPLARGWLANGDGFVVAEHLEGRAVAGPPGDPEHPERSRLLQALADGIATLHAAGFRHGDLHLGNFRDTSSGIALLDVQHARRTKDPTDRLRDLAQLELSMARAGWSVAERVALRDELGPDPRFDRILRHFLHDHLRGRRRRVLRVDRNWAVAVVGRARGRRERDLSPTTLERLLGSDIDRSSIGSRRGGRVEVYEAKSDGRVFVIKEYAAPRGLRPWVDAVRGSRAARAFRVGQAHALLRAHAARPLAYLEERHLGTPRRSWLVLEHVGDEDLDRCRPASEAMQRRIAHALGDWVADVHAWGLQHRDLKAGNLRVAIRPDAIRFWLVDVEDLRGPSEPADESRRVALAQLNASLPDEAFGLAARRGALDRYLARFPFPSDRDALERDLGRRSLARSHRWRGEGCECRDH